MSIFVDTGIFVAANNKSDNRHSRAVEVMREALEGRYGVIFTSDYVIDEAVTTALARTHDHRIALNTGSYIIESPRIQKIHTDSDDFGRGWSKFQNLAKKPMSFTDCISLVHIEKRKMGRIMSFDSGFDGLIERVY